MRFIAAIICRFVSHRGAPGSPTGKSDAAAVVPYLPGN